ncbi:MAG TPA: hypothetical protein P5511_03730 [Candidatus Goldiibacteriota bacterium]|nr:hypothetical protein [Candidatus Goldiibacteriota bacterium]
MSPFIVSSISDTQKFRVVYGWKCGNKKGLFIRPAGCRTPGRGMPGYEPAMKKLYSLILGKEVQVGEVVEISSDTMTARIYYKGKELKYYFPEYN